MRKRYCKDCRFIGLRGTHCLKNYKEPDNYFEGIYKDGPELTEVKNANSDCKDFDMKFIHKVNQFFWTVFGIGESYWWDKDVV